MRLHDLRGTFVSQLLEAAVDLRTVQELARHSDPRTTQAMYARSRTETKVVAIEKLRGRMATEQPQAGTMDREPQTGTVLPESERRAATLTR